MLFAMMLVAAEVEPIGGLSGWSAFGLTGLILGWLLLQHLPSKDKQLERLIDAHNLRVDGLVNKFNASLEIVVKHCDEEMDQIRTEFFKRLEYMAQRITKNE